MTIANIYTRFSRYCRSVSFFIQISIISLLLILFFIPFFLTKIGINEYRSKIDRYETYLKEYDRTKIDVKKDPQNALDQKSKRLLAFIHLMSGTTVELTQRPNYSNDKIYIWSITNFENDRILKTRTLVSWITINSKVKNFEFLSNHSKFIYYSKFIHSRAGINTTFKTLSIGYLFDIKERIFVENNSGNRIKLLLLSKWYRNKHKVNKLKKDFEKVQYYYYVDKYFILISIIIFFSICLFSYVIVFHSFDNFINKEITVFSNNKKRNYIIEEIEQGLLFQILWSSHINRWRKGADLIQLRKSIKNKIIKYAIFNRDQKNQIKNLAKKNNTTEAQITYALISNAERKTRKKNQKKHRFNGGDPIINQQEIDEIRNVIETPEYEALFQSKDIDDSDYDSKEESSDSTISVIEPYQDEITEKRNACFEKIRAVVHGGLKNMAFLNLEELELLSENLRNIRQYLSSDNYDQFISDFDGNQRKTFEPVLNLVKAEQFDQLNSVFEDSSIEQQPTKPSSNEDYSENDLNIIAEFLKDKSVAIVGADEHRADFFIETITELGGNNVKYVKSSSAILNAAQADIFYIFWRFIEHKQFRQLEKKGVICIYVEKPSQSMFKMDTIEKTLIYLNSKKATE